MADSKNRFARHDALMACNLRSGNSDSLIRGGAVADIAALKRFILEQINPIEGIDKIRSSFALKQVRDTSALPLPRA